MGGGDDEVVSHCLLMAGRARFPQTPRPVRTPLPIRIIAKSVNTEHVLSTPKSSEISSGNYSNFGLNNRRARIGYFSFHAQLLFF